MKLIHRIYGTFDQLQQELLGQFGIAAESGVHTSVDLDDRTYQVVEKHFANSIDGHFKIASFDRNEIESAEWLALRGLTKMGYPQPEDAWELEDVYDLQNACVICKLPFGLQIAPFRIRANSRPRPLSQLEWVYGELFASVDFFEANLRPMGLGNRPVLIHRTGEVSANVVQVEIPIAEWKFDFSRLPSQHCTECGALKYQATPENVLPSIGGNPPNEIFVGTEPFGSGGQAYRRIYVSNRLCRILIAEKIAGWKQFYPLQNSDETVGFI